MKVYLAAGFSRKEEIHQYAQQLRLAGLEVTSRWLEEEAAANSTLADVNDEYLRKHAAIDIEDIDAADVLCLFTIPPTTPFVRGGRHFESGYAFGTGKLIVTVGPRENIFHYLPTVFNAPDWSSAKQMLEALDGLSKDR